MSLNNVPVSGRTAPYDKRLTANGSYTLPQYAFIPHASLQLLAGPIVPGPAIGNDLATAGFAAPPNLNARPYPTGNRPGVYGIRSIQVKASP